MTTRHEVTCIIPHTAADGRIHAIGGTDGGGWTMLEDKAIRGIQIGAFTRWTQAAGKIAEVVPHQEVNGRWFLKSVADGVLSNNLLHLPRCPTMYMPVS